MKKLLYLFFLMTYSYSFSLPLEDYVLDYIKKHEGLRLKVYVCPGGKRTIGYGHSIKSNENFIEITKQQANNLLREDFKNARKFVYKVLPNLTYPQHLAISHFVYCIGSGNFMKSTLYKNLKNNEPINKSIVMWCKIKGKTNKNLLEQRKWELNMFYLNDY